MTEHIPTVLTNAADIIDRDGWWNGVDDNPYCDTKDVTGAIDAAGGEFNGPTYQAFVTYLHAAGISGFSTVSEWNDLACGDQETAVATLRGAAQWYAGQEIAA